MVLARSAAVLSFLVLAACGEAAPPASEAPAAEAAPASAEAAPAHEGHTEPAPATAAADATGWAHYGTPFATQESIAAATFFGDPSQYVGKTVRVEGKVTDVCQKAGCWMVVAEGDKTMRIRMKDHGFSVDKAGAGCTASVEGTVVAIPVDPATVEHYASESADPKAMPENKATGGVVYEIEATAVAMKRG